MVELDGLGLVGYVANSPYTVFGESMNVCRLWGIHQLKKSIDAGT